MAAKPSRFAPAERASEAEVRRQSRAVEAQTLLREVLATVPDLLLVLNNQRQVVYANHVLVKHLGLEPAVVLGLRPGEMVGCVNADNDSGGCGTNRGCRTCGVVGTLLASVAGDEAEQEARLALKTGEGLDLRVRTRPVKIGGENLIVMTLKDIADEKRRRVLERVFFHDVLNTAGGVQGLASLLRDSDAEQARVITDMLESSAAQLVDEIQAQRLLTSVEGQDYTADVSRVSLTRVIPEVVATYLPLGQSSGVAVEALGDLPEEEIDTDRTMLGRVLGNLTKNAIEASSAGMTVLVGARLVGDDVEFWVHNPTAMPEEAQLQVFQRSFSTKGAGRGLGTYSVKLFTERYLGGSVDFESSDEIGTIFRVRIPLVWR